MYNFASEFDVMQERMGTPDDGPGESNNDDDISRTALWATGPLWVLTRHHARLSHAP